MGQYALCTTQTGLQNLLKLHNKYKSYRKGVRNIKKIFIVLLALISSTIIFPSVALATSGEAKIRVLHASPDAPAVDIYANGNKVLENVPFGTLSGYLSVPKGEYRIQIRPAGKQTPIVIDEEVHVGGHKFYTLAASGKLSNIKLLTFLDKDRARESGQPRIRVIHLSPNAPSVDIGVVGQKPFIRDLAYQERSSYKRLPVGTFDIQVRIAGTDTTALTIPNVTVANGLSATVYAIGLVGGSPSLSTVIGIDGQ